MELLTWDSSYFNNSGGFSMIKDLTGLPVDDDLIYYEEYGSMTCGDCIHCFEVHKTKETWCPVCKCEPDIKDTVREIECLNFKE